MTANILCGCGAASLLGMVDRERRPVQMTPDDFDSLKGKAKKLSEIIWENRITSLNIDLWLDNFTGECLSEDVERLNALYLLTKFLYFGQKEIQELLRAMFRDHFRHRISVKVRSSLPNKDDFHMLHQRFLDELNRTRFFGVGNPAESGSHILYYFRQVNGLPNRIFPSLNQLCSGGLNDPSTQWTHPNVGRLVFIDDFCGRHQASKFSHQNIPLLRKIALRSSVNVEFWYLILVATTDGLEFLRQNSDFDHVESVAELDSSYRTFGDDSQIYRHPPAGVDKREATDMANHYGKSLWSAHPLGYRDSQLLLGFNHNVPDNTLPVIWHDDPIRPWNAIFPRAPKQ